MSKDVKAQATEKGLGLRIEDMRATDGCLITNSLRLNQVLVNIIGIEASAMEPRYRIRETVRD